MYASIINFLDSNLGVRDVFLKSSRIGKNWKGQITLDRNFELLLKGFELENSPQPLSICLQKPLSTLSLCTSLITRVLIPLTLRPYSLSSRS
ncbi:hypothetical protein NC652_008543 [Populus alba x Populus x berolinensis]|nr:hypothetical protein NC652_008543 [Populus alba x Populus x berolinensis]